METTTKDFFNTLFPDLNGGFIEVRSIHPVDHDVQVRFYESIDQLIHQFPAQVLAKSFNTYFGVCPRSRKEGTKDAVKEIRCFWIDIDGKDFQGGKTQALTRLNEFPVPPTVTVDSGNGYHAYWALKEAETDKRSVESYLRGLCSALGGDKSSCEVARVLRFPGTSNHKDPANILPVRIIQINSSRAYNLSDFDAFIDPEAERSVGVGKSDDWVADALSKLSEGNRNSTFASIIGRLHRNSLPASSILALLSPHAEKCHFPKDELRHEVDGICNRYPNPELNSQISLNSPVAFEKKWPDPLREDAFHGLLGDIIRKIEPHTESDPAALLVQAMVVFGNVVGRSAHFMAEADKHYLNIFSVMVGSTSKGRKGTSFGHIKRLFRGIDSTWLPDRIPSGLSSGEGLIWAVRDKIEKREPINKKKLFLGYQDIEIDAGISDKRLLVVEAEFASPLRVIGREGNTLSPLIRQAWDTGMLETLTKNSPAKATNAHISIVGHITGDELRRYLDKTETANGFGNRFLWVCTKRSKILAEGGRLQDEDFAPLVRQLIAAVEHAKTVSEIKRDESLKAYWRELYVLLSKEAPGLLGSMTARSEPQVMRLACIYALLDATNTIRLEHLKAALAVWDYCDASVRYIFGDDLGDPIADTILAAIRSNPDGLSRTDISRLFQRHLESSQIARALKLLEETGLIKVSFIKTPGRSQEVWTAVAK